MISLVCQPLPPALLSAAVELDRKVLGGFWSDAAYQQEYERISSDLWGIWPCDAVLQSPNLQLPNLQLPNLQLPNLQSPSLLGMGCAWTILDEVHVILLAVHPQYRHQGLGYGLLLELLAAAHQRGANYATLEVRASNQPAIALYTKLGFAIAGRRRNYYSDIGKDAREDALVLWRSGLQSPEFSAEIKSHWQTITDRWPQWEWHSNAPQPGVHQPPKNEASD